MATLVRPEITEKSKYWIHRNRHYELKHFCLQYPYWKRKYAELENPSGSLAMFEWRSSTNIPGDPTGKRAIIRTYYSDRIDLVERTARQADPYLYPYILKAVTEGLSYTYLKNTMNMPCGRDMYYDRYRKFFWLLNNSRD